MLTLRTQLPSKGRSLGRRRALREPNPQSSIPIDLPLPLPRGDDRGVPLHQIVPCAKRAGLTKPYRHGTLATLPM